VNISFVAWEVLICLLVSQSVDHRVTDLKRFNCARIYIHLF